MSTDPATTEFFGANGIPDGGCLRVPVAAEDGDMCQPGGTPADFVVFVIFFIVVPSVTVFLLLLCTFRAICLGCGTCVGYCGWLCCCCCGSGDGDKVTRCWCYEVAEDASMVPFLPCLCNAGPSHPVKDSEAGGFCSPPQNDAWCCNKYCCCLGRPCTYCGIACCPPGSDTNATDTATAPAA